MGATAFAGASALIEELAAKPPEEATPDLRKRLLRLLDQASPSTQAELAQLLEARALWKWVRWITPHLADRVNVTSVSAAWLALDALAAFLTSEFDDAAAQALAVHNATLATNDEGVSRAKVRALTVLGYTRDVAGDHASATAWYREALDRARAEQRAALLLEIATSLSKQGAYEASLTAFAHADAALVHVADAQQARRLRAQVLSRRAVVMEIMGNPALAVELQREGIATARDADDVSGAFTASLRLARHLSAMQRYDEALEVLDTVTEAAPARRNGLLYLTHDRARILRAKRSWIDARDAYTLAIAQLPRAGRAVIIGNLDVWLELTHGLSGVLESLDDHERAALAILANATAKSVADARGIYGGEPVQRAVLVDRAARAVENLRMALIANAIVTKNYLVDLDANTLARHGSTETPRPLRPADLAILRFLHAQRQRVVTKRELYEALKKAGPAKGSRERFKDVIDEMRDRLGLGSNDLIVGKPGPKGGYTLEEQTKLPRPEDPTRAIEEENDRERR